MKERENLHQKAGKGSVRCLIWLVDLNYNFKYDWLTTRAFNTVKGPGNEVDWLIELSDNNLTSELVENRSKYLNQS